MVSSFVLPWLMARVLHSRKLVAALCLSILNIAPAPTRAESADAVDWPTLGFVQIVPNHFNSPTCIANAADGSGRLFIAERAAKIWIIQDGAVVPLPFLDISTLVTTKGPEQGL